MSNPKHQPKILLRRPKKSHRAPSDPSSQGDGTGGARSVSTASSNSAPPSSDLKRPFWYRFRTALSTLLILNVVVIGYTVFRTSTKTAEVPEEAQSAKMTDTEKERDEKISKEETAIERAQNEKKPLEETLTEKVTDEKKPIKVEIEKKKAEKLHTKRELRESPKVQQAINLSKQRLSNEEQQELFKWLLAEKRKVKPANKAEKSRIDAEKAVLKEFLRGKRGLNV